MNTLQTKPERDFFALVIAVILLGVLLLQLGFAVGSLDRRVTALETATTSGR